MTNAQGNELKRDSYPEKYYEIGNPLKEILPVVVSFIIISFFSGNLLVAGGINTVISIAFETVFVVGMSSFFYIAFKGMKKRMSEVYISVCENGICGIRVINGYKNGEFSVAYSEINKVENKGERVLIYTNQGKMIFLLRDASGTAQLIRQKISL